MNHSTISWNEWLDTSPKQSEDRLDKLERVCVDNGFKPVVHMHGNNGMEMLRAYRLHNIVVVSSIHSDYFISGRYRIETKIHAKGDNYDHETQSKLVKSFKNLYRNNLSQSRGQTNGLDIWSRLYYFV